MLTTIELDRNNERYTRPGYVTDTGTQIESSGLTKDEMVAWQAGKLRSVLISTVDGVIEQALCPPPYYIHQRHRAVAERILLRYLPTTED